VNVRIFENASHIGFSARSFALKLGHSLYPFGIQIFVDITDRFYKDVIFFGHSGPPAEVAETLAPGPDNAHVQAIVGPDDASITSGGHAHGRCGDAGSPNCHLFEGIST
jgi:hypothetical protein